jgi:tetratricopeptide (TPR) repeat protein
MSSGNLAPKIFQIPPTLAALCVERHLQHLEDSEQLTELLEHLTDATILSAISPHRALHTAWLRRWRLLTSAHPDLSLRSVIASEHGSALKRVDLLISLARFATEINSLESATDALTRALALLDGKQVEVLTRQGPAKQARFWELSTQCHLAFSRLGLASGSLDASHADLALAIARQHLPGDVGLACEALEEKSRLLQKRGDHSEAMALLEASLAQRRVGGVLADESAATLLHNIGNCLFHLERFDEALARFTDALRLREAVFGAERASLEVAASLNNIALALVEVGRHDEAIDHFERSLEMKRELLGKSHPDVARGIHNIGNAHHMRKDLVQAKEFLGIALGMREAQDRDHPDTALSALALGLVEADMGNLDDAERLLRRALEIREKVFGESAKLLAPLRALETVIRKKGDRDDEAEIIYARCKVIQRESKKVPAVGPSPSPSPRVG